LPVIAAGLGGPVAVIHGRGINTVWVLAASLALSRPLSPLIVWAASAPPSISPSTTGGLTRSCVHIPLIFYNSCSTAHVLQRHSNFQTSTVAKFATIRRWHRTAETVTLGFAQKRKFAGSAQGFCAPPSFGRTRLRNKVQALKTNTCSQRKPKF
jgi:hypothetical protein